MLLTIANIREKYLLALSLLENFDCEVDLLTQSSNILALCDEVDAFIEQGYDVGLFKEENLLVEMQDGIEDIKHQLSKKLENKTYSSEFSLDLKAWNALLDRLFLSSSEGEQLFNPKLLEQLKPLHSLYRKEFMSMSVKEDRKSIEKELRSIECPKEREERLEKFFHTLDNKDAFKVITKILSLRGEDYALKKVSTMSISSIDKVNFLVDEKINSIKEEFSKINTVDPSDFFYQLDKSSNNEAVVNVDTYLSHLFELIESLLGVSFQEVSERTWDGKVKVLNLYKDEELIGKWYIDLYKRAGKYPGNWTQTALSRRKLLDGKVQTPVVFLGFCFEENNLSFAQTRPLLHEFGHALEHCLNPEIRYTLSGTNHLTKDTCEISSLYMETLIDHPKLMSLFGEKDCVIESYKKEQLKDLAYIALMSKIDLEIHSRSIQNTEQLNKVVEGVIKKSGINYPLVNSSYLSIFDHAFWDESYASTYYCYLMGAICAEKLKEYPQEKFWNNTDKTSFVNEILGDCHA